MIQTIYQTIIELLKLSVNSVVFWEILPLIVLAIIIILYYGKYNETDLGWNTYTTNALTILFVSVALLRHIYNLDYLGAGSFLEYPAKSLVTAFLLFLGAFVLRSNFDRIFPKKIVKYISSPLFLTTLAFAIILYVHTTLPDSVELIISLIIIFIITLAILRLLEFPSKKTFEIVNKMKIKERFQNIKQEKFEIKELKEDVKVREKKLSKFELAKLEKEKKRAIKLKKEIKKPLSKVKKP